MIWEVEYENLVVRNSGNLTWAPSRVGPMLLSPLRFGSCPFPLEMPHIQWQIAATDPYRNNSHCSGGNTRIDKERKTRQE